MLGLPQMQGDGCVSVNWNMDYLGVMVDMAGCPNRCRHCWLGSHKNGAMTRDEFRKTAEQFRNWRNENGDGIKELGFFSWWREPDYRNDYKELWALEQELSSPGCAKRFELLSVWRLARDENYAKWAAALEPRFCQISFFGVEAATDWGARRKGAFVDNLLATERLLKVGLTPRWQLFLTKSGLGDLDEFLRLIYRLNLHKRCEAIGQPFEVFISGMSPEGNGFEIDSLRVDEDDLAILPSSLIDICREGIDLLGEPEYKLLELLKCDDAPPNMSADVHAVAVNADFDVYPNIAEPTEWWRLGNLKADGIDAIIKAYRDEATPGMRANREISISELAQKFGNSNSKKLYSKDDLICRFMHQLSIN